MMAVIRIVTLVHKGMTALREMIMGLRYTASMLTKRLTLSITFGSIDNDLGHQIYFAISYWLKIKISYHN
jgi:hypothetical protein